MRAGANHPLSRRIFTLLAKLLYWIAVLAASFAVLVGLILFLEARDTSQVGQGNRGPAAPPLPGNPPPLVPLDRL